MALMKKWSDIRRIVNARVMTPEGEIIGTVTFEDGVITGIIPQKEKDLPEADSWDAGGAFLVPGGIDAHVHFGGFGPPTIADTFETGTMAALAGGTTTVMDFCESEAGESPAHCIDRRMKDAERSFCDYRFHFVLTKDYRRQISQLDYLRSRGIRDYKLFTVYGNTDLTYSQIGEIFRTLEDEPLATFLIHAEDPDLVRKSEDKVRRSPHEEMDMLLHAKSRPSFAEAEAVRKIVRLRKEHPVSVCIAHVSAGETLDVMDQVPPSSGNGMPRFIFESCPHYFEFQDDKLSGENGNRFVMTPPLRKKEDSRRLWEAVFDGRISILSTDHCPYRICDLTGKSWDKMPGGVDGANVRMIYFYSEGVVKRDLSMSKYVRLTSENAARFYHLYPKKGAIAVGSDADLTLISTAGRTVYGMDEADSEMESRSCRRHEEVSGLKSADSKRGGVLPLRGGIDHSIYENKVFSGRISAVFKGGVLAYDGENILAQPGCGRYLL